jgi:hypothetical protein
MSPCRSRLARPAAADHQAYGTGSVIYSTESASIYTPCIRSSLSTNYVGRHTERVASIYKPIAKSVHGDTCRELIVVDAAWFIVTRVALGEWCDIAGGNPIDCIAGGEVDGTTEG